MTHIIDNTHIIVYVKNHPPFLVTIEDTDTPIMDIRDTYIPLIYDRLLTKDPAVTDSIYLQIFSATDTPDTYARIYFPNTKNPDGRRDSFLKIYNFRYAKKDIPGTVQFTITITKL